MFLEVYPHTEQDLGIVCLENYSDLKIQNAKQLDALHVLYNAAITD